MASIGPRGRAGAYWPADPAVDVQAVSDVRVKSLRSIFKEPFVERLEDMPVKPDVLHVHGLWLPIGQNDSLGQLAWNPRGDQHARDADAVGD